MLESVSAVILNKEAFEQADINSLQQESVCISINRHGDCNIIGKM